MLFDNTAPLMLSMALKLFPVQFPIFGPTINPNPSNRPATELRFARWNNANAEKFNQRKREQQEIEDDIRRIRRFESATNIIDNYETATPSTSTNTVTFKSTGTPSSPSKPSIPGLKSKYSKHGSRVSHPAFRRVRKVTKLPLPAFQTDGEKTEIDRRAEVSVSEDGVSYVIDGAPFEFKYSYTETPALKPVKLREPPFSPFGPTTMGRPWTGKAPLPPSKKKVREFDSFVLPPPNKKGVKTVQAPGPFRPGSGPKYVRSREEILGEPLTKEEVKELIDSCVRSSRQLNMGRDGFTHNMLENIHAHWKRRRVCKIKCKGVCTVDMDNVCQQLEERTGGKIIFQKGGVLYLFRGRNYNYKTRPKYPLMLWRPVTPVYPRLIQRVPDGLTLEEATNMRKKGRDLIPICKLAKNGVYSNLVKLVREAFEACELVRINCRGLNGSDYRKIGAKLRDLVPCVLISFEGEHILMWRGKNWKSSFLIPVNKSEEVETSNASHQSLMVQHLSDDQDHDSELVSNNNESLSDLDIDEHLESSDEEAEDLSTVEIEQPYALGDSSSTSSEACRNIAMLDNSVGVNYAFNEREDEDSRFSAAATLENPCRDTEMSSTASVESDFSRDGADRAKEKQDVMEGDNHCRDQVKLNPSCVEVLLQLMKQAVEHGSAVIISDENLDDDSVYQRAVSFARSAPHGPVFKRRCREKASVQKLENAEAKSPVPKDFSSDPTQRDRKERRSSKLERELESQKEYLDAAPKGKLGIDELAKLLA